MIKEYNMKECEKILYNSLVKIENIHHLLKDGKYIVANDKLLGVRQNIAYLHNKIKEKNENNKDI